MKIRGKIIGLGLTTKLLLAGSTLLIIPWLGVQSLNTMQSFLVEGQAQAQLLTARGIATLLQGRSDLFQNPADAPIKEGENTTTDFADIPLYPLAGQILLDAYQEDWQALSTRTLTFGDPEKTSFTLLLGQTSNNIYGFIRVTDTTPVYRHPGYLRLDHSDHIRLYLKNNQADDRRYLLTFEGNGRITAYQMDENWRYAESGTAEYRIEGQVRILKDGYTIEFGLPLSFLDTSQQLGIGVADASDPEERVIDTISKSFATVPQGDYNQLIVRSPETERVLKGLAQTDSRIWILDNKLQVRATAGQWQNDADYLPADEPVADLQVASIFNALLDRLSGARHGPIKDFNPAQTHAREGAFLQAALQGKASVITRPALGSDHTIVAAVHPILHSDNRSIMGIVLLEQSTNAILNMQSRSLQRMVLLTLSAFLLISLVVLAYSSRLTLRIKRLGNDTHKASDEQGRMREKHNFRGLNNGDEIGELTRNVEQLLHRLNRYQQFLVAIPRTLRHEINNPLNTVSTSLEHLEEQVPDHTYLDSARRGLHRISAITDNLAEAASLEDALTADSLTRVDLNHLLTNYVSNQQRQTADGQPVSIELIAPKHEVWVLGSDIHLEQLLDKLLDNAVDFSPPNLPVEFRLTTGKKHCFLRIKNFGQPIPEAQITELFQMFHSHRYTEAEDSVHQHLGLGLYIARVICERHGGDLTVENLAADDGVVFTATLPLTG
ncbi:MAG: hypothetical protein DRR42_18770 [Gammaproteobacteria bacterium]|nr:MAG: hypothetical protein DRR42_18770 [Gammaproteobacteria bacterium]